MQRVTEKLLIDAGVSWDGEAGLRVAAEVVAPPADRLGDNPVALVCLAGGNMNRRYYDLRPEDGDETFSFALQMSARGFIVVMIDYLGLGESTRPADCYALTPEVLTHAAINASAHLLFKLRKGSLSPALPAMPALKSLGIGHSMGAMMTTLHQAAAKQHEGIALLGFSTRGLPAYLPPKVVAMTREEQRAGLAGFAQKMFQTQYPVIRSSGNGESVYGSKKAEPKGVAALKQATDCLLPVTAYLSMLPGNVAPEAATVSVPVLLAHGERDMAGPPVESAAAFTASPDVRVLVLPETGHSHFLFPTRLDLFDRLADWAQSVIRFSNK